MLHLRFINIYREREAERVEGSMSMRAGVVLNVAWGCSFCYIC